MRLSDTFKNLEWSHYIILAGIASGVAICIWTPEYYLFKKIAEYAIHLVFAYMFVGLIFIIANQKTLVYASFLAALVLALYLKQNSNEKLRYPQPTSGPNISVAVMNLSSLNENFNKTFEKIKESNYDVLAFQEVSPGWYNFLTGYLGENYSHQAALIRIDEHGQMLFSNKPIVDIDTFYSNDIPALVARVAMSNIDEAMIFSAHPPPALNIRTYEQVRNYLDASADYIASAKLPTICLGDFNLVSWSPEIRTFKVKSNLTNSRRSYNPLSSIQNDGGMSRPLQHIFFTSEIECTAFTEISFSGKSQLGVSGNYQFSDNRKVLGALIQE